VESDTHTHTVLVIDGASSTCIPLTDHLRRRGLRCEIHGTVKGATEYLNRTSAERWPRLALIHFPPVDADGLEVFAALRQRHPNLPLVAFADLGMVSGIIFDQAERMDVRFLSLPFDFARVDATVDAAIAHPGRNRDEGGAFGTSRHVRGNTSRYDEPVPTDLPAPAPQVAPVARPTTRALRNPQTGSIRRSVDTGIVRRDTTSERIRRGTDQFAASPGASSGTTRIRRGVTGRYLNPDAQPPADQGQAPQTTSQRRVRCAICGQAFHVALRLVSYTLPCVHCGGLNRIDPP